MWTIETVIYWIIVFMMLVFVLLDLFKEKTMAGKISCAIISIPLLLRVLMIK